MGCTLPLVAEYRNTFRYVLDVLHILVQIRDHAFHRLSDLEQTRLSTPFRTKSQSFTGSSVSSGKHHGWRNAVRS